MTGPYTSGLWKWTALVLMFTSATVVAQDACPENYELALEDGPCLRFSDDRQTYQDANQTCHDEGARLVVIKSAELNTYIVNRINTTYAFNTWIGLDDLTPPSGQYRWSDGSLLNASDFQDWAPTQPDTYWQEKCGEIWPDVDYQWNNHQCYLEQSYICELEEVPCLYPLGMESGFIPDSRIFAPTYVTNGEPYRGRLNHIAGLGAWVPAETYPNLWLQVDLGEIRFVTGTMIQGRHGTDQWVTSFKLQYSNDGESWTTYADSNGIDVTFSGSVDRDTPVTNLLDDPIDTRYVRFVARTARNWISMRVELLGCRNTPGLCEPDPCVHGTCRSGENSPICDCDEGYEGDTCETPIVCRVPLGMESGFIPDDRITALSYNIDSEPYRGRLYGVAGIGAWSPAANYANLWLQVDLGEIRRVTGVITQGRHSASQWVTRFRLWYSSDGTTWTSYAGSDGLEKTFIGNADSNTPITNILDNPIDTRYVRFVVRTVHNGICLRAELLGCANTPGHCDPDPCVHGTCRSGQNSSICDCDEWYEGEYCETAIVCRNPLGMQSGLIPDGSITASSYNNGSEPFLARLNGAGSWSPTTVDRERWLQVDLSTVKRVTGIIIQGSPIGLVWVTLFRLQYSTDGTTWSVYVDSNGLIKTFSGSADRNTPITNILETPIDTRYVRILAHHPHNWYAMRIELLGCDNCLDYPLGMESGFIPNARITSNSYQIDGEPFRGRLNHTDGLGGWVSELNNVPRVYLQIDLGEIRSVTGAITQGCHDYDWYVTSFELQYSYDGFGWMTYTGSDGLAKNFPGNADSNTPVTNVLDNPINTRYVRFVATGFRGHFYSMRAELLGCNNNPGHCQPDPCVHGTCRSGQNTFICDCDEGYEGETCNTAIVCRHPLGMESGVIPDWRITASSYHDGYEPFYGRLHRDDGLGAWTANPDNRNQWLQIDLGEIMRVTGTIIQGRFGVQWMVRSFKLQYSTDNATWVTYPGSDGIDMEFPGSIGSNTPVTNLLDNPIRAQYVRFVPWTWRPHISMRVELLGCNDTVVVGGYCNPDPCVHGTCRSGETSFICDCDYGYEGDTCNDTAEVAVCWAWGDPHYILFDGGQHHFQGPCRYTLAQDCGSNHFNVTTQNVPVPARPIVSEVREVFVEAHGFVVGIHQGRTVTVDGVPYSLPFSLAGGMIEVSLIGLFVRVRLTFYHVEVIYNGVNIVKVQVPSNFKADMCGLCGNFNDNRNDDFMMPDGSVVADLNTFGNSWLTDSDTCPGGSQQAKRRKRNAELTPLSDCDAAVQAAAESADNCGLLQDPNGPFGVCHIAVDFETYFDSCVFDMCAWNGNTTALCQNLAAYYDACQEAGVAPFSWRTADRCPHLCPPHSTFLTCADACPPTCLHPLGRRCVTCVEGCQCDHGFVRSGQQCVPEEQCGCTDDEGRYYVLGERFEKDGHLCICETGNDIICQECDEGYRPALRDGVWGCHRVDYPAVPCPEGYGDKYGFGKCLYVHKRPLIYSEAEAYCQDMGGKIFQFDNEDDVNRIKTILPSAGFGIWVGLTDEDTEGTFVWADGTPLVSGDFSDWAPQPYVRNSAQWDCVVMKRRFNWQWVVRSCSKANYFACESN